MNSFRWRMERIEEGRESPDLCGRTEAQNRIRAPPSDKRVRHAGTLKVTSGNSTSVVHISFQPSLRHNLYGRDNPTTPRQTGSSEENQRIFSGSSSVGGHGEAERRGKVFVRVGEFWFRRNLRIRASGTRDTFFHQAKEPKGTMRRSSRSFNAPPSRGGKSSRYSTV